MLICGGGALLGSKCMEIKVSYVQARRFIDFHTLILNSYIKLIIRNTQFLFCHKLSFLIRQSVLQPDFMTGRNKKTTDVLLKNRDGFVTNPYLQPLHHPSSPERQSRYIPPTVSRLRSSNTASAGNVPGSACQRPKIHIHGNSAAESLLE